MGIIEVEGDITECTCDAIVNPVNCVGVMGGGVAKAIKDKFPWCVPPYKDACERQIIRPGGAFVVSLEVQPAIEYPTIINIATKNHWRGKTRIEWEDQALQNLASLLSGGEFRTVAMPRPGCGLGGLDWEDVKPLVGTHLGNLECRITIFNKPPETSEDQKGSTQATLNFEEE